MPRKLSLHIGLNQVDPVHYSGWDGTLFGCENDAHEYKLIADGKGFESNEMLTANATSINVVNFLNRAAVKLKSGDTFFLTYAGHGGFIPDLNNDEVDKKDETWCLFDRQLIDDELFEAFRKFREGVKILLFSDSCHSGTVARMMPPDNELKKDIEHVLAKNKIISRLAPADVLVRTYNENLVTYKPILQGHPVFSRDVSAFVMLFAACQDNETAKEQGTNGIFTQTVKNVLGKNSFATYVELFTEIKRNIQPEIQIPNLFKYGNESFDFSEEVPFDGVADQSSKDRIPSVDKNNESAFIKHGTSPSKDSRIIIYKSNNTKEVRQLPKNRAVQEENAWDEAYAVYLANKENGTVNFVEPDIACRFILPSENKSRGNSNNYLSNWPQPAADKNEFIWHLDDAHSQLRSACDEVLRKVPPASVRIGHVDTGYLEHPSNPEKLLVDLGKSFVNGEGNNKGKDLLKAGAIAEQDGHGCATVAILAGKKIVKSDSYCDYEGFFGAVPFAEVIPIRICDTVYNFFNANDVADGFEYAVNQGCEVITMSMAGYPTRRVAEAVNKAYDKGVVMVTAAGNNWAKGFQKLTPKAVLYPARFERVIAATGACFNHEPYTLDANGFFSRSAGGEFMQGNWGPPKAMKKALAGYTPNLPWANFAGDLFLRSGGGTSSSTPQVAAAAALWLAYNRKQLEDSGYEPWQKVEAVRTALFRSASKTFPDYKKYYGNGIVRALDALNSFNIKEEKNTLKKSAEATVRFLGIFDFIGQWIRSRSFAANSALQDDSIKEMLSLEIVQIIHQDEKLFRFADAIEYESVDGWEFLQDKNAYAEFSKLIRESPYASQFLKTNLPLAQG